MREFIRHALLHKTDISLPQDNLKTNYNRPKLQSVPLVANAIGRRQAGLLLYMNGKGLSEEQDLFSSFWESEENSQQGTSDFEDADTVLAKLRKSQFRSRFFLNKSEREYVMSKGIETIRQHAAQIIRQRLAPAHIPNDGKQTPMRHGAHPVFLAQHATACCCRGCFQKWHGIPPGRELTAAEQHFAVNLIIAWITKQVE